MSASAASTAASASNQQPKLSQQSQPQIKKSASSGASTALPLRFKCPIDYPHIAKFTDTADFTAAKRPLRLYFKEEELREEPEIEVRKDGAYYRRRRAQRRNYRRRSTLVLEDSSMHALGNSNNCSSSSSSNNNSSNSGGGSSMLVQEALKSATGFRFEGRSCNLSLAEFEDQKKQDINAVGNVHSAAAAAAAKDASSSAATATTAKDGSNNGSSSNNSSSSSEAPFKYVVLQFIRKPDNSSEINVIPVGNMYAMKRRTGLLEDELLMDIDERYIEEKQKVKANLSRYKGISLFLQQAERRHAERDGVAYVPGREFRGGFDSDGLFGSQRQQQQQQQQQRDNGSSGISSNGGVEEMLTESGVDKELLQQSSDWSGDYSTRFVDDDEDNVQQEQQLLNEETDREMSSAMRDDSHARMAAGDDGDSDYSSSDDSSAADEQKDADDWRSSRVIDQQMIDGANEAKVAFKQMQSAAAAGNNGTESAVAAAVAGLRPVDLSEQPKKSALKRSRAEAELSDDATATTAAAAGNSTSHHHVSFQEPSIVDADADADEGNNISSDGGGGGGRVKPRLAGSSRSSAAAAVTEYTLTARGVRQFIANKGGKVTMRDLDFFKPQLLEYDSHMKAQGAGMKRFLELLDKVAIKTEDPFLGPVMELREATTGDV